MRILLFNIRECEYYFHFYVYYFMTCDINWRSFYRLIIYYINTNIYCTSSAVKSLLEFWNLNPINLINPNPIPVCPLATFRNYCKIASSQSNRHKTDYYRITDAHNTHSIFLFSMQNLQILVCCTESYPVIYIALWNMEFITLWTPGVKKTNEYLFLIFANANVLFNIRICECECSDHH